MTWWCKEPLYQQVKLKFSSNVYYNIIYYFTSCFSLILNSTAYCHNVILSHHVHHHDSNVSSSTIVSHYLIFFIHSLSLWSSQNFLIHRRDIYHPQHRDKCFIFISNVFLFHEMLTYDIPWRQQDMTRILIKLIDSWTTWPTKHFMKTLSNPNIYFTEIQITWKFVP